MAYKRIIEFKQLRELFNIEKLNIENNVKEREIANAIKFALADIPYNNIIIFPTTSLILQGKKDISVLVYILYHLEECRTILKEEKYKNYTEIEIEQIVQEIILQVIILENKQEIKYYL